jgi:hypothetical protein
MRVTVSASTATPPEPLILAPPDLAEAGIFRLWFGDVNDDCRIDHEDVSIVNGQLGVNVFDPRYNPAFDSNADGIIDPEDLNNINPHLEKTVMDYSGTEGVDPLK